MNISYQKLVNKKEEKKELTPVKMMPILCCPGCATIKSSMCSKCGSFYCWTCSKVRTSSMMPWSTKDFYYYYCNKEGVIKEGHDPVCFKKDSTATEIAKEVCLQLQLQKMEVDAQLPKTILQESNTEIKKDPEQKQDEEEKNLIEFNTKYNLISEWRKDNPRDQKLPKYLHNLFIGKPASNARKLYNCVRIFKRTDHIHEDFIPDRLNLLCNDEEAQIIIEVKGFF